MSKDALLIIDMFNRLSFPGADRLAPNAVNIASPIASMARQFSQAGGSVFYVNDDVARGKADLEALRQAMVDQGGIPAEIALRMDVAIPAQVILKPQHSAFYQTDLDDRLKISGAKRLTIVGVAADLCVLASAVDGCMRNYEVHIVSNLVAAETTGRLRRALVLLRRSFNIKVVPWEGIPLVGR